MLRSVPAKIRVVVVDDSHFMRKRISDLINTDPSCEVIATARNGEEALRVIALTRPDVVTLDVELPKMNGLAVLKRVMSDCPTPVVMLSAYTQIGAKITFECLESGALDFAGKPSGEISLDIGKIKDELLSKIQAAASANINLVKRLPFNKRPRKHKKSHVYSHKIVAIASSTGGPRTLCELLPEIEPDIAATILVTQHMPAGFVAPMVRRLHEISRVYVKEAASGEAMTQGVAFFAPGGFHLLLGKGSSGAIARLIKADPSNSLCPLADLTMNSLAPLYGENALGVVLTGMGSDGTEGLRTIKDFGGSTIVQDRSTSIVYGMPKAAWDAGVADKQLPMDKIAQEIMRWSAL